MDRLGSIMPSIFTRIIEGEIPGTFVWRDPECVAFMSINPLRRGHTLVVPRMEVDHWIDAPDGLRDYLFQVAQTVARAVQTAFEPTRIGLMIAGLEVPHLHLHVVPIDGVHDLDFANAAATVDREELEESAEMIRAELRGLGAAGVAD
jgi:histidine triad (HIT) family protein